MFSQYNEAGFCPHKFQDFLNKKTPHTSVLTEKCVVADGARFGEGVELVQPFSGDVELQQAGLLHIGQSHHLLPLSHRLLTTFPARVQKKIQSVMNLHHFCVNV